MMMQDKHSAIAAYRDTGVQTGVEGAGRHGLIAMLLDGALERLSCARGLMERGDMAGKGEALGRALDIIASLRGCLDTERGGELAGRLESLYDYMERRLAQASIDNRSDLVDEVIALLTEVRAGWQAIPAEPGAAG